MEAVRLHGIVEGAGQGLVLLHPIGLDHTFWADLPEKLGSGRRILHLDIRGHGESPAGPGRAPMSAYAADVAAAIRGHGLERPIVLGLSFGGMIAQTVALEHPDAVGGLILCGCPGGIPVEARPILQERGLAAERGGMEAIVPATLERWFTPAFTDQAVLDRVRQRLLADSVPAWSDGWHAIAAFDALPRLGMLSIPTLVVSGERDAATTPAASKTLADAIPGARLVTLPGAPHMMQLETPGPFIETVGRFLADVPEARSA